MWQTDIVFAKSPRSSLDVECLSDLLLQTGVTAVEEIQIRKRLRGLRVYFPGQLHKHKLRRDVSAIIQTAQQNFPQIAFLKPRIVVRRFEDVSWKTGWKRFAKPVPVGGKILILPSHFKKIPEHYRHLKIILRIDPDMAFGSGGHPTTRLCLKALVDLAKSNSNIRSVLDFGTGSGILAIAGSRLGFPRVVAIDNDPEAVRVAKENAKRHGLQKKISARCGSAKEVTGKYDLIVSNVMLSVFNEHLHRLRRHLNRHGIIVLSGLLLREEKEIRALLRKNRLKLTKALRWRGWLCVIASS